MAKKNAVLPEQKDWSLALTAINKKLQGTGGKLFRLDSDDILEMEVIPTRLLNLDLALGVLGIPCGRVIEIYGPESSGKSSLALQLVKSAQIKFPDRPVLYVDLEHALNKDWAINRLKIESDRFWLLQPGSAEEALDAIDIAANIGAPSLIIVDSIAAMSPQCELDGEAADSTVGVVARLMGKCLRKITKTLAQNNVTFICINQIRSKIGPYAGEATSGGNALKFYASQRLRTRKTGDIGGNNDIIGIQVLVDVKKNKVAPPFKSADVSLFFKSGFSEELSLLKAASDKNLVAKKGAWFAYKETSIGQGEVKSAVYLKKNPEVAEAIRNEILTIHEKQFETENEEGDSSSLSGEASEEGENVQEG